MNDDAFMQTHAVGRVCNAWAGLELFIDMNIWRLLGLNKKTELAACVTNEIMSIHTKLKVLISLCHALKIDEKTIKKLRTFSQSLYGTADKRNRAVHDAWLALERFNASGQVNIARDKTNMSEFLRQTTLKELEDLVQEIEEKMDKFTEISRYLNVPSASSE